VAADGDTRAALGQILQPDIARITPEDLYHRVLGSILKWGQLLTPADEFALLE
jgi:hypothetical protein